MADGRHIGNRKLAITLQPVNRLRRNFAGTCRLWTANRAEGKMLLQKCKGIPIL